MRPGASDSGDAGSATVYVCLLAAAVAVVTCVSVVLGRVAVHRARAASAADLAALAAAARLAHGERAACDAAAVVSSAHGGELEECEWDGPVVTVRVRIAVTGLVWLGDADVRAESRAGPQA